MSAIFGTTKIYSKDILERKLKQMRFNDHMDGNRTESPFLYPVENNSFVLNGTIYNQANLYALYAQYKEKCLQYLNGDFAFVIYDKEVDRLFGAVDRVGAKTLYYHCGEDGFEFSSQLLPLCIGNKYHIDEYARCCYFTMQYIPSPMSIIQEVRKLNPGEYFIYDLKTKQLDVQTYWDLYDNTCGFATPKTYEEAVSQMKSLLTDAVELRMNTDAPIGLFLSGGIDSSTISLLARKIKTDIEAYSVGFSENGFDESQYAQVVADRLAIKLHHIQCTPQKAMDVIDGLMQYYDEPMGDASMIPTSMLCQQTAQFAKVALGGDGGDEMFFGYPRYLRYAMRSGVYRIPVPIRQMIAEVTEFLGQKRVATSLRMKDVQSLYMNRRPSNEAELFEALTIQQSLWQCKYLYADRDIRRCFNDFDIKTLMTHAYNVKLDRAALRASLETRCPMLNYRIVEYSRLLPIEYCYNEQLGMKRMLRDILYQELPKELFERKKQGFGVPIGRWMRKELRDWLLDRINEQTMSFLPDFVPQKMIDIRDKHISGKEDQTTLLWMAALYIDWRNMFMDTLRN